ncbi:MAG TPA: cell division topological specificity factor MinE [Halothiobacillus sp.]|nr:cell division topological specificity factor MinE [Halothiobacillus sp.]
MGLLDIFRNQRKPPSAKIAKERLQILIAHERQQGQRPDYLPLLEKDLLEVIRRYVEVSDDAVNMRVESSEGMEILELNITLPERSESKSSE